MSRGLAIPFSVRKSKGKSYGGIAALSRKGPGKIGLWSGCCLLTLGLTFTLLGQTQTGELRIAVTDSTGLPVGGSVNLVSESNQYSRTFALDGDGIALAKRLPFGMYRVDVQHEGLASSSRLIDIRSAIPRNLKVVLSVATIASAVDVNDGDTLVDPYRTGTINRIGRETIRDRVSSSPGRSVSDLVNEQPGWLLEANGILHPRGSVRVQRDSADRDSRTRLCSRFRRR
jgi:hypothetical protein